MPFVKEDLVSDHYNWGNSSQSLVFKGHPSRRLFDRFNGEQVLFIINFYGTISDKVSVKEGRKMEAMINSSLPIDAKSEISVFNWLRNVC
jgi:hypothetical protein